MNLKKLTVVFTFAALVGACTRDEGPRRPDVKPIPPAPTGNTNTNVGGNSSPNLVSEDNKRRERKRHELVTTNPGISHAPLLRKPRIDDVLAVNIGGVPAQKNSLQHLKLSIVMKVGNQIVSVKFVSEKKMSAQGPYQALTLVDKSQKLSAEARCLISCSDILVRVRRDNGEETAFVFKDSELTLIPDLEKDVNAGRVRKSSRVLEVGYVVSDSLEAIQKSISSHKVVVDGMLSEKNDESDLRQASELLTTLLSDLLAASNDVYELSRLSISNATPTPEQLGAGPQNLVKALQSLAMIRSLIKQESLSLEMQKDLARIEQVRPKVQLMAELLSKN